MLRLKSHQVLSPEPSMFVQRAGLYLIYNHAKKPIQVTLYRLKWDAVTSAYRYVDNIKAKASHEPFLRPWSNLDSTDTSPQQTVKLRTDNLENLFDVFF